MICGFLVAGWACRWEWYVTVGALLLWPPVLVSYGQFTLIWLLGLALAWRYREQSFIAGIAIGFAALPKFFAALALGPYVRRKDWGAIAGFATAWALALGTLLAIDGHAITAYFVANRHNATEQITRSDNGALLPFSAHLFGPVGVIIAATLMVGVALTVFRRSTDDSTSWWAWVWFSTALLPIAWSYSVLPLLPGLAAGLRTERGPTVRILSALALCAPYIGPLPPRSPLAVALCIALAGMALAFYNLHRHAGDTAASDITGELKALIGPQLQGPMIDILSPTGPRAPSSPVPEPQQWSQRYRPLPLC